MSRRKRGPRKRSPHAPHVQTIETRARQHSRAVYEEVTRCREAIEADRDRRRSDPKRAQAGQKGER